MYTAVLDTCVLVPDLQRDFLLQLAAERAYAPKWGTGILTELDNVLAELDARRGLPNRAAHRARLLAQMNSVFPGAVEGAPKSVEHRYDLRDPDDEHVAHAALLGKANAIVTSDRRSGMESSKLLKQASIEVIAPHTFAANIVAAHPSAGVSALVELSRRRRRTPQNPVEILEQLRKRFAMNTVHAFLMNELRDLD